MFQAMEYSFIPFIPHISSLEEKENGISFTPTVSYFEWSGYHYKEIENIQKVLHRQKEKSIMNHIL